MRAFQDGNKLRTERGPIVLRGANAVRYNWRWPDSSHPQDVHAARVFTRRVEDGGWGANCVTIWVESDPVMGRGRNRQSNATESRRYMDWLDAMVDVISGNGAYPLLSWHADAPHIDHPRHITGLGLQAMASLAQRYRANTFVIFAAQAEPGNGGEMHSQLSWNALVPHIEGTIDAIRAESPDVLVGVPGRMWSQEVAGMLSNPVKCENIFVKPHLYGSHPSTVNGRKVPEIAQTWPVVIGEFGTGGRMNNTDSRELIRYADEHLSGWQAWNYADIGEPVMLTSWSNVTPNAYGTVVKNELLREVAAPVPPPDEEPEPEPLVVVPFRVNAGGDAHQDAESRIWLKDREWDGRGPYGYSYHPQATATGSAAHVVSIAEPELYATERYGVGVYRIRIPNGKYDVKVHFAETWDGIDGPGQRVFGIHVQGSKVGDMDVYAEAGHGTPVAVIEEGVAVTDEMLEVSFEIVTQNPMVKGIEVVEHDPGQEEPEPPTECEEALEEAKAALADMRDARDVAEQERKDLADVLNRVRELLGG